jgi:LPXTG-site transpeptidase (sortase) family protein
LLVGGGAIAGVLGFALIAVAAITMLGGGDDKTELPPVVKLTVTPSPTPLVPLVTAAPTPSPVPAPPLGDRPYTMSIPAIGVVAPVQTYGLDADQVPEVPTGADAADIVAWYNFSAKPGVGSNAVFAGHVDWFGPAVFYDLTDLAPGDDISLRADDGTELIYKVADVFDVSASDPNATQVMAGTPTDTLTIITCTGDFTDTNDPVFGGEYDRRHVVKANLESTTPGSAVSAAGSDSGG